MQKWQYLRDEVETEAQLDEKLAQLGELGWELVAVCYTEPKFSVTGEAEPFSPWKLFLKKPI